jgi:hypothetical protein
MSPGAVRPHVVLLALIGFALTGCASAAREIEPAPAPASISPVLAATSSPIAAPTVSAPATPDPIASKYGFPAEIDPAARYLFYLHGKIIEDQGLPAVSPEFGEYQYQEILDALASYGFIVISEHRPRDADGWEYAGRVVRQVGELTEAGVPPRNITIVGASKGAAIAAVVSYVVGDPEVNCVLLGACHPTQVDDLAQQGVVVSGNVLAIRDEADTEYSGSCEELFVLSEGKGLGRHEELVLQVGTGHGILYQPLAEWIVPTVRWANQEW